MNTQAVALLIGNDLGACASIFVQSRMRSSQDREVDPIESQRLQARMDAAAQNVVRQERRYNPLARKRPSLIVPLRQIRDPGYYYSRSKISAPTPTSRISSVLVG